MDEQLGIDFAEAGFMARDQEGPLLMSSTYIIATLALFTIGVTLATAIFHFGYFLKEPKNLEAAKRVAEDTASAAAGGVDGQGRSMKTLPQRLNGSRASARWRRVKGVQSDPASMPL